MKPRAVLNEQQALEIFALRPRSDSRKLAASYVGARFGVNEKTVRDIWVGRTWSRATILLRESDENLSAKFLAPSKLGRPKGSKDTRPRDFRARSGHAEGSSCSRRPLISSTSQNGRSNSNSTLDLTRAGKNKSKLYITSQLSRQASRCLKAHPIQTIDSVHKAAAETLLSIDDMLHFWAQSASMSTHATIAEDPFGQDWARKSYELRMSFCSQAT